MKIFSYLRMIFSLKSKKKNPQ